MRTIIVSLVLCLMSFGGKCLAFVPVPSDYLAKLSCTTQVIVKPEGGVIYCNICCDDHGNCWITNCW